MEHITDASSRINITFSAGFRAEFALGTVTEGKEDWMFGEYFPAVRPALDENGQGALGSFVVLATNRSGVMPSMGAITHWPSPDARRRFHEDPRFVEIQPQRDAALDLLDDGHLFAAVDQVLELEPNMDYAIIIASENPLDREPLVELPFAADGPNTRHAGKTLMLHPWNDAARASMGATGATAEVYRVRFNPPGA